MAQKGDYTRQMSIKINKALDAIGVNEEIVQIRRNCYLQIECNYIAIRQCSIPPHEALYFGSQSEGTTTIGLDSDTDYVYCSRTVRIVHNVPRYLGELQMIKSSSPGYCFLRDTVGIFKKHLKSFHDASFVKNSYHVFTDWFGETLEMEGPAILYKSQDGDFINCVLAFPCEAWPRDVAEEFVSCQRHRVWPSKDLVDQILMSECFVVPKGSDIGDNSDIEWRISFSYGERLLMFDLNTVQIRCYILMKYIKTTFLDNIAKGVISSYICKTAMFHVISQTQKSIWTEEELLSNLNHCLSMLRKFIQDQNCPHFIMPANNLLAGKLDSRERNQLSHELDRIIASDGRALFDVTIDTFGESLQPDREVTDTGVLLYIKFNLVFDVMHHLSAAWQKEYSEWQSFRIPSECLNVLVDIFKKKVGLLVKLSRRINNTDTRMIDAVKMIMSKLSTMLGSCLASNDYRRKRGLSHEAFQWLLLGVQYSDVASSHLKLASVLFSERDLESTGIILNDISKKTINENMDSICTCGRRCKRSATLHFFEASLDNKRFAQILREHIGFCVTFLPCEIQGCPKELQYEMFRSTFCKQNALPSGHITHTNWIHYAVISPEPFLYLMQYKLYKELQKPIKRQEALRKLELIACDRKLECIHDETRWNLVGQCWEQEGYVGLQAAVYAYIRSLALQPNYNAARILICCNLYKHIVLRR